MIRVKVKVAGVTKKYGNDAEVLLEFYDDSGNEQDNSFDFEGDGTWIRISPDGLEEFPLGRIFYLDLIPVEDIKAAIQ